MKSDSEEFVRLLTEAQGPVYGYLLTLIPDRNRARDLLQETNITLWKKAATFEEGTNFNAWACKIAYFHVLSFRRKMAREKLVFDDDILELNCLFACHALSNEMPKSFSLPLNNLSLIHI